MSDTVKSCETCASYGSDDRRPPCLYCGAQPDFAAWTPRPTPGTAAESDPHPDDILAGMAASNNWGQNYREEFDSIYPDLATKYGVTMVPFFMEGVWGDPKLLLVDGLHPNPAGVAKIVDKIAPYVEKALAAAGPGAHSRAP